MTNVIQQTPLIGIRCPGSEGAGPKRLRAIHLAKISQLGQTDTLAALIRSFQYGYLSHLECEWVS